MTLQKFFTHFKLEQSAPETTEDLINSVIKEDFPSKDSFIKFYCEHNGGYLPSPDAHYYRDSIYAVSKNDYNAMHVEGFYFIPQFSEERHQMLMPITRVRNIHKTHSKNSRGFSLTHIPFSFDASGNIYWIDVFSGRIKFVNLEKEDEVIDDIAPSFCEFCENIEVRHRNK